jgi:hypothetical protein
VIEVLVAPLALILAVLGSIPGGVATPTEAASVGAVGAMLPGPPRAADGSPAAGGGQDRADHLHDS